MTCGIWAKYFKLTEFPIFVKYSRNNHIGPSRLWSEFSAIVDVFVMNPVKPMQASSYYC